MTNKTAQAIEDRILRVRDLKFFIENLKKQSEAIDTFDLGLFGYLVEGITVFSRNDIRVMFRDGTEVKTDI